VHESGPAGSFGHSRCRSEVSADDLDVDELLGGKSRHRCGANVIHPDELAAHGEAEPLDEPAGLLGPCRVGIGNKGVQPSWRSVARSQVGLKWHEPVSPQTVDLLARLIDRCIRR
jgi:hypothetical protein